MAGATKGFASYEDALASLRANANPTAEELTKIEAAIQRISKSTGMGPTQVATVMGDLLKAGLSLQDVLGGTAEATLQFAKVAKMEVEPASKVLVKAMNIFGVGAVEAADAMSNAADASTADVADMAMSFTQAAATAGQVGLTIHETANALAILSDRATGAGSDAGTSLRTMLLRLMAPAEEGAKAFNELGLEIRDANKEMKPFRDIIGELESKLAKKDPEKRAKLMRDLFGADAIRAGIGLVVDGGVKAWDKFGDSVKNSLPVAAKFAILMNTISGFVQRARSTLESLAVEIGAALAPSFREWGEALSDAARTLTTLIKNNKPFVVQVAKIVGLVVAAGAAFILLSGPITAIGVLLGGLATAFGALVATIGLIGSPIGLIIIAVGALVAATVDLKAVMGQALAWLGEKWKGFSALVKLTLGGILDAMKAGDMKLAQDILAASFDVLGLKIAKAFDDLWIEVKAGAIHNFHAIAIEAEQIIGNMLTELAGRARLELAALNPLNSMDDLREIKRKIDFEAAGPDLRAAGKVADEKLRDVERRREMAAGIDTTALDAAEAELRRLVELAKNLANQPPPIPDDFVEGGALPRKKPLGFGDNVSAAINAIRGKVDVAGTFSGAALSQMGVGSTIEDETLKEAKKHTDLLTSIDRNGKRGPGLPIV